MKAVDIKEYLIIWFNYFKFTRFIITFNFILITATAFASIIRTTKNL
jgi:hypothetical protein